MRGYKSFDMDSGNSIYSAIAETSSGMRNYLMGVMSIASEPLCRNTGKTGQISTRTRRTQLYHRLFGSAK